MEPLVNSVAVHPQPSYNSFPTNGGGERRGEAFSKWAKQSIPLMIKLMSWWTTAHPTWVLIEIYNILMQVGEFYSSWLCSPKSDSKKWTQVVWNPNCTVNHDNHGAVTYLWAKHKFFSYKWLAGLSSYHDLMASLVILQNSSKL